MSMVNTSEMLGVRGTGESVLSWYRDSVNHLLEIICFLNTKVLFRDW